MLGLSFKKTQATLHFDPFCSLFRFRLIFTGSGIKIYKDFGIRDQNLRPKCGISGKKIYRVTTLPRGTSKSGGDDENAQGACTNDDQRVN